MWPTVPPEMIGSAVALAVSFFSVVAALLSFVLVGRLS
jgi:hypothetical protein